MLTELAELLAMIQSLEVKLHQPVTRTNASAVDALLHDDFEEIGRSGQCYDKQQTVTTLLREHGQAEIFSEGFMLATIVEGAVLLTYRSFHRSADGVVTGCTLRSSIWVLSSENGSDHWQMRFHQGTPTVDAR